MKIQYMSDLHLEFMDNSRFIKNNEFEVKGDILVLAGDSFYLQDTVVPRYRFDDVDFILTTLWSKIPEVYQTCAKVPKEVPIEVAELFALAEVYFTTQRPDNVKNAVTLHHS